MPKKGSPNFQLFICHATIEWFVPWTRKTASSGRLSHDMVALCVQIHLQASWIESIRLTLHHTQRTN
eukprot:scaffold105010_cov41-Prasinocladus_malaysianus.AAC.1